MRTFYIVWFGQLVSSLGSALTSFAVGLWLFTEGGSVTAFALNNVFYLVPWALLSPVAGAYVDRYNRRKIMLIADSVQALASLFIALFIFADGLQIWHVYIAVALSSAAGAFQGPAWSASIPLIVPKSQLGRASGMGNIGSSVGRLIAPAAAGVLILVIGLGGIVLIDFVTFLVAVTALLFVHIPDPPREDKAEDEEQSNVFQDFLFGIRYLYVRRGLFLLVVVGSLRNLFQNMATVLTVPMMLTFTNEAVVGTVFSIAMSGMLIGTLLITAWGGPQRRVPWVAGVLIVQGLAIAVIGWQPTIAYVIGGGFVMFFSFAFLSALLPPIRQTKVALDVQGRVTATMIFLAVILEPLGHAIVGPLADNFFEPWMAAGGALSSSFGLLLGVGPGRGMGLIFVICGLIVSGLGLFTILHPRIRRLEIELPDVIPDDPLDEVEVQAVTA
ncbi:MAG: MFS transporter [Chloroflexi bacterium]|nr:MFS transporter [Chloroflexota bacterium]